MNAQAHTPVAVITGAGRGIGRATALRFAAMGYRLVLVSRSMDQLQETARLAGDAMCQCVAADVGDEASVRRVIQTAIDFAGRIDVLVNNAGHALRLDVGQTSPSQFASQFATNLFGPFALVHHAWPWLKQSKGVIVNVSSQAARDPLGGFHAYASAKAALNMLTLTLAREGAAHGIRAVAVAPGAVETKALRDIASVEDFPSQFTLDPDDVARVIVDCAAGSLAHCSGEVIWMKK